MRCSDALVVDGGLGGSSRVSYAGSYGTEPLAGSAGWRGGNHANVAVPACVRRSRAIGRPAAARSGAEGANCTRVLPPNLGQRQANGRDERLCGTDAHSPDPAEAAPLAQYPAARRHGGRWRVVARCQGGRWRGGCTPQSLVDGWSSRSHAWPLCSARRGPWCRLPGLSAACCGHCILGLSGVLDGVSGVCRWGCRAELFGRWRLVDGFGLGGVISTRPMSGRAGLPRPACRHLRLPHTGRRLPVPPDGFYDPPGNAPAPPCRPPQGPRCRDHRPVRGGCVVVPRASRVRRIGWRGVRGRRCQGRPVEWRVEVVAVAWWWGDGGAALHALRNGVACVGDWVLGGGGCG